MVYLNKMVIALVQVVVLAKILSNMQNVWHTIINDWYASHNSQLIFVQLLNIGGKFDHLAV